MPKRKKRAEIVRRAAFKYRGKTAEELKEMDPSDMVSLLLSRARRSMQRGLTEEQYKLIMKVRENESDKLIKTHCRDMVILPEFVGQRIGVHNGKTFVESRITTEMIGHFLGEFSPTRKMVKHTGPGVGATKSSKYVPLK
jgi:small subunit ribosomal protein S19